MGKRPTMIDLVKRIDTLFEMNRRQADMIERLEEQLAGERPVMPRSEMERIIKLQVTLRGQAKAIQKFLSHLTDNQLAAMVAEIKAGEW